MTRPEGPERATTDDAPGSGPGTEAADAPASGTTDSPTVPQPTVPQPIVPQPTAVPPTEGAADEPTEALSGTIAALTADNLDQSERRRLLGRLAGDIRARGVGDLFRPRAAMRWVADAVGDIAPR